jgi:hypothetical protein
MRLLSTLNYWDTINPLFIVQLNYLRSKKIWREKLVLAENVTFHRPKLAKSRSAKSYRELGRKIQDIYTVIPIFKWRALEYGRINSFVLYQCLI